MCLCGGHFTYSGYTKHLEGFVSYIYPKVMVALIGLLDSSEDNLSAYLTAQLASHFKEKVWLCFCRLQPLSSILLIFSSTN